MGYCTKEYNEKYLESTPKPPLPHFFVANSYFDPRLSAQSPPIGTSTLPRIPESYSYASNSHTPHSSPRPAISGEHNPKICHKLALLRAHQPQNIFTQKPPIICRIQKFILSLHPQTRDNPYFATHTAEIAQLVEHNLAKVGVASSSLVFRSKSKDWLSANLF